MWSDDVKPRERRAFYVALVAGSIALVTQFIDALWPLTLAVAVVGFVAIAIALHEQNKRFKRWRWRG